MIPIVVVGHPQREKWANRLAAEVQADCIVWDIRSDGCLFNHIQAWQWLAADYDAEWGVVLEDDVIPCNHFRRNLEAAVKHSPESFLSLYLGRGRPPHRQQDIARVICSDVSYFTDDDMLSTQGYAARIDTFEAWPELETYANLTCEKAISAWGTRFAYCRESVIDHIDGTTLISDHGDGQPRNGKTALWTPGMDPRGKDLPEIRKAWLVANTQTVWTKGSLALPTDGKQQGQTDGICGSSQRSGSDQAGPGGQEKSDPAYAG